MGWWRSFLDSLDTNGGHLAMLLTLIVIGGAFYVKVDATSGGQIISLSFGALLMALKTAGTNSEQIARAGAPYQPPQPPPTALTPPIVVDSTTPPAVPVVDTATVAVPVTVTATTPNAPVTTAVPVHVTAAAAVVPAPAPVPPIPVERPTL